MQRAHENKSGLEWKVGNRTSFSLFGCLFFMLANTVALLSSHYGNIHKSQMIMLNGRLQCFRGGSVARCIAAMKHDGCGTSALFDDMMSYGS